MKIKRKFRPKLEQNITIIKNAKVKTLKIPYTPQQAKKFVRG